MNGITQCSGDDSSPCSVTNTTRWDKTEPPTDMSFRGSESESRNLPKWQILPCVGYYCNLGRFLHSADAQDLNDTSIGGFIQPHRLYIQRSGRQIAAPTDTPVRGLIQPHGLYSECGMAMNHRRYIAWFHSTARVMFETLRAARLPPLHTQGPVLGWKLFLAVL